MELPAGYYLEGLPSSTDGSRPGIGIYEAKYSSDGNKLRLHRRFELEKDFFPVSEYSGLHLFYDSVRAGNEQVAVLRKNGAGQKN